MALIFLKSASDTKKLLQGANGGQFSRKEQRGAKVLSSA